MLISNFYEHEYWIFFFNVLSGENRCSKTSNLHCTNQITLSFIKQPPFSQHTTTTSRTHRKRSLMKEKKVIIKISARESYHSQPAILTYKCLHPWIRKSQQK